jgi:diaminopimelate decarboxylase
MPEIEEGDILGILNAGAYGFTMSSNYNSRPLTSEILVTDGKCSVVREKETFEDLYAKQSIPPHLK